MRSIIISLLILICHISHSQEIPLSLEDVENTLELTSCGFISNDELIFSIGEPLIGTINFGEYSVSQGFIQREETEKNKFEELTLKFYPNPSTSLIYVRFPRTETIQKFNYTIFDQHGIAHRSGILTKDATTLDISLLPAAIYYIKIRNMKNSFTQTNQFVKI